MLPLYPVSCPHLKMPSVFLILRQTLLALIKLNDMILYRVGRFCTSSPLFTSLLHPQLSGDFVYSRITFFFKINSSIDLPLTMCSPLSNSCGFFHTTQFFVECFGHQWLPCFLCFVSLLQSKLSAITIQL